MVQELWELFQLEDEHPEYQVSSPTTSEELFLALSKAAASGSDGPRTVKLSGFIQHLHVTLLVDSGSSASFISAHLAAHLSGICSLPTAVSVKVAGGSTLSCYSVLP